jgi:hypothetical protein
MLGCDRKQVNEPSQIAPKADGPRLADYKREPESDCYETLLKNLE